jgi:hypothetical protein
MVLLSAFVSGVAYARDLSHYRTFALGMSVATIAQEIGEKPSDATTVHERPALIQQMTWWSSDGTARRGEAIQQVRFSFYEGKLYRMAVTYDAFATKGLSAQDVEAALAAQYGTPTGRTGEVKSDYGRAESVLARWEDSQYSLNLIRSSLSNRLGLIVLTKRLDALAEAAATEADDLEVRDAALKERTRVKAEADDLNTARHENLGPFLP